MTLRPLSLRLSAWAWPWEPKPSPRQPTPLTCAVVHPVGDQGIPHQERYIEPRTATPQVAGVVAQGSIGTEVDGNPSIRAYVQLDRSRSHRWVGSRLPLRLIGSVDVPTRDRRAKCRREGRFPAEPPRSTTWPRWDVQPRKSGRTGWRMTADMRIAPRNPVCPTVCRKGFGADEAVPPQCRSRSLDNISSSDIVAFMGTPNPREFLPLPPTQFHILVALSAGELHGYAIMQAVESTSDRLVKIGPATL